MEYISASQAAAKWGVSLREVQRLLREGRISNAKKYGNYWVLPADAEKPLDRRVARKAAPAYAFLPDMAIPRGDPEKALQGLTGETLALARADIAYRRGDPEPAKTAWRAISPKEPSMLSTASLATAAAISSGDYGLYYAIQEVLDGCAVGAEEKTAALLSLPGVLAAVSMALPDMAPGWLSRCDFSLFPAEMRPFLLFLYAMHMRNTGNREAQLSTARTAVILSERADTFTWLDVDLWLLCASACFALGHTEQARLYLLTAMELGLPCGFILPFADILGDLGGLVEDCLERYYPQYLSPVLEKWEVSFKNWMRFHNEFSRANVTTILMPREYHIARLLSAGESYAAVGRRMRLSVGRVKNIQFVIYDKLHISKRNELKAYMI